MKKVDVALLISIMLLGGVYFLSLYAHFSPREEYIIAKVFDHDYREASDITVIFTHGRGILKFYGKVEVEDGKRYLFIYKYGGRYKSTYKLVELVPQ